MLAAYVNIILELSVHFGISDYTYLGQSVLLIVWVLVGGMLFKLRHVKIMSPYVLNTWCNAALAALLEVI